MASFLVQKWVTCFWLVAAVLPKLSISKDTAGDDERLLANPPPCSVDVSGNYSGAYGKLTLTQKADCSLFMEPPGQVAGMVTGRTVYVAGEEGSPSDGGKLVFTNGKAWTRASGLPHGGWPVPAGYVAPHAAPVGVPIGKPFPLKSSSAPCATVAWTPQINKPDKPDKPFPLWAVGTAGAIASAGAIAGGVAAGLTLSDDKAGHPNDAKHGFLKRVKEPVLAVAQPAAAAQSPVDLLVGMAILSCCCVLMLGIACVNFCSSKSPKDNRSLMAFSKVEEHEEQDEEDEAASEEDGLYIEEDDYTGDTNQCGFTDGTQSQHAALLQNTVEIFHSTLSPRPVDAE